MSGYNRTLSIGNLPVVSQLTPTEAKIYSFLLAGKTPAEIAKELGVLEKSVKRRISVVNEKVRVR